MQGCAFDDECSYWTKTFISSVWGVKNIPTHLEAFNEHLLTSIELFLPKLYIFQFFLNISIF